MPGKSNSACDHISKHGITVKILGDFNPFSKMGKSIGYQISIGNSNYLIDCGAPLFQQLGSRGIEEIKGVVITHCHDDHKRWFTDLCLYKLYMYRPDLSKKVHLLTSEDVMNELYRACGPAMDRSLSADSERVVDIAAEDYVDTSLIGPKARYRIAHNYNYDGRSRLSVLDEKGNEVGPEMAKIIINPKTKRSRLLFRDPEYREWVEPDSFYSFSSLIFYGEENVYSDAEGFTISAIKAPVWHGIPSIGLKIRTDHETLIFSSDTIHNLPLWKKLTEKKRIRRIGSDRRSFENASVIYGDINDYIERTWSRERYLEAETAFNEGIIIHDVASRSSVVHTDYEALHLTSLRKEKTILTHSPDTITSEWVLTDSDKTFLILQDKFYEIVGNEMYEMDASIYHREGGGQYFAGYKKRDGNYLVYKRNGLLGISRDGLPEGAEELYRVDLYEDIAGRYYPKIENGNARYVRRSDGKVEYIEFNEGGSSGRVVEDRRGAVSRKPFVFSPR